MKEIHRSLDSLRREKPLEEEPSEPISLDPEVEEKRRSIEAKRKNIRRFLDSLREKPLEEEPIELDSEEEPLEEEPSEPISLDPEVEEKRRSIEEKIEDIHPSLDSLREKPLEEEPSDSLPIDREGNELRRSSEEKIEDIHPSLDSLREKPLEEEPIELDSDEEEEPYLNYCDSYQDRTGLLEAVQTGTGQLNGIPVAIGIMDFEFMGGSMGAVVGEKITRLIEYATNQLLPLIIVCASGGARMQEGSLSLMQMAKISSALYDYQMNQELFYVAILTSPTTGGVTASFGMLGDIIIAEPKAHIAFAGKRVIEEMLKIEVPEGSQSAEILFDKGLVDSIISRKDLKEFLSELFEFHGLYD
uniref:Acetyl-coenzyme A carboxylase carboxyl transferase subunit beta, chloroplastic n=1 Tax=Vicia bungei TaxID=153952 RepID=A0A6M4SQD4_9FABA|nr:AccD [Vicia bungei]